MRFLLKLLLTAIAFVAILPMIPGIAVHGNFVVAIGLAVGFGIMLWAVDLVALAISAALTISSFGLALLWLIPMWILGFWLLPAFALKMMADIFPTYVSISGWTAAILGGLVMMVIGIVTTDFADRTVAT